jgi:hypothetical protein
MDYNEFYNKIEISEENIKQYLSESKYGGYPEEPSGSVWSMEGKSLFLLIRHLKPKRILELGNYKGVSSNHILQAVELNGFGDVTLLDIHDYIEYDKIHNQNFNRLIDDSLNYLDNEIDFDFIVVDDNHEYEHVKKELSLIYQNNKPKNYYIWTHDYFAVEGLGVGVKTAWDETENLINQTSYKILGPESNCGFVFSEIKN